MKIKSIVTGATGMVGEGVLHECLIHESVEEVLVIGRRSCKIRHIKLKEIIQPDMFDISVLDDQLKGYNACYFCLGISSVGMKEDQYKKITYDLTMNFANKLVELNKDMIFCYVSGAGTDSSEKGRSMWARIKGKTENDLLKLPFKKAFMFRPGFMQPTKGLKNTLRMYKNLGWLYPVLKLLLPGFVCKLSDLGKAMIKVCTNDYEKTVINTRDIIQLNY
ncbi:MAG: NAD-dependent epimerase/dehydratase family protein [Bacteroidales bacterium]|nr:NAD-dependent epimerase/dehydratase family protein [Bacteroidales bacterium]